MHRNLREAKIKAFSFLNREHVLGHVWYDTYPSLLSQEVKSMRLNFAGFFFQRQCHMQHVHERNIVKQDVKNIQLLIYIYGNVFFTSALFKTSFAFSTTMTLILVDS